MPSGGAGCELARGSCPGGQGIDCIVSHSGHPRGLWELATSPNNLMTVLNPLPTPQSLIYALRVNGGERWATREGGKVRRACTQTNIQTVCRMGGRRGDLWAGALGVQWVDGTWPVGICIHEHATSRLQVAHRAGGWRGDLWAGEAAGRTERSNGWRVGPKHTQPQVANCVSDRRAGW